MIPLLEAVCEVLKPLPHIHRPCKRTESMRNLLFVGALAVSSSAAVFNNSAAAGQLDLIRLADQFAIGSEWSVTPNYFANVSGDGKKFEAIYDCGPAADCAYQPFLFDDTTYEVNPIPFEEVRDLSFDGRFAVGRDHPIGPVRWSAGDAETLALDDRRDASHDDVAISVSDDGSVVVGQSRERAFLWTAENGRQNIPNTSRRYSYARGVSADGTVVVGGTLQGGNMTQGFRWTEESGLETLPTIEGYESANITNISADGSTVIGTNRRAILPAGESSNTTGYMWSEATGPTNLGEFYPIRVNGDGSVILGDRSIWLDGEILSFTEFVLKETGVNMPNLWLSGVSDDGKTFSGVAYDLIGFTAGVILRVGEFELCDLNADGLCDASDIDAMRLVPGNLYRSTYDLNEDGKIDMSDRQSWVTEHLSTSFGDANLDGEFNSSDLTQMFSQSRYETGETAGWRDGDFNGDGLADSSDLILAFASASYEKGPRAVAVPESANFALWLSSAVAAISLRFSPTRQSCSN